MNGSPANRPLTLSSVTGFFLASVLLLIPCFWQPHIHAGDLASHAYNAWLTLLVERGEAPSLYIVHPWTNVLFDLMLVETMRRFGADWAQRISVSLCVLVFFWSAFSFLWTFAGRRTWRIVPLLAVLSYGWAFQMGFFNFYLGAGLGIWACVALTKRSALRIALAVLLFALSAYAHVLATAYCLMLCAAAQALSRLRLRGRLWFLGIAGTCLLGAGVAVQLAGLGVSGWRLPIMLGADAYSSVSPESILTLMAYFLLAITLIARHLTRKSAGRIFGDRSTQLVALTIVAEFALPGTVTVAGYLTPVEFVRLRFEVFLALAMLAYVSSTRPGRAFHLIAAVIAANFFFWFYAESRHSELIERSVADVVRQTPRGARVLAILKTRMGLIDPIGHVVDRACIGHCFSYANYEPGTAAFRLRATIGSRIALGDISRLRQEIVTGRFVVQDNDLPLTAIVADYKPSLAMSTYSPEPGEVLHEILLPSLGEKIALEYMPWLGGWFKKNSGQNSQHHPSSEEKDSGGQGGGDAS